MNIKLALSSPASSTLRRLQRRVAPLMAAFLATLVSLPAHAVVTWPNVPLQSGSSFPSPDIMFILDDSGSMARDYMPDSVASVSPSDISALAYPRNGLSYNPATTYLPWIKSDLTRYSGGTSYTTTSAYDDDNALTTAIDLSSSVKTFYVPTSAAADMSQTASYNRYQILSGGTDIIKGFWGAAATSGASSAAGFPVAGLTAPTGMNAFVFNYSIPVPANAMAITITTSGGTENGNGADLYVRQGATQTTSTYDCRSIGTTNAETCTISLNNPGAASTIFAGIFRSSASSTSFNNVSLAVTYTTTNRCSGTGSGNTWINCVSALPNAGRTLAQELTNYATWYSYYRTRIKMAKGGASEAFSKIGSNVRVGFNTIWNRNSYNIPVATDNGLFRDLTTPTATTNRSTWYSRLVGASASQGTPLKGALQRTGTYYQNTTATGPWGPEVGTAQISCRQTFAILTTDGYWNDDSGYTSPVGDTDTTGVNKNNANLTSDNPLLLDVDGVALPYYAPVHPYRDPTARANTLADVAMYYWKNDLVSTLTNDVPASASDPAVWQHMTTFGISIGQEGTLDPATDFANILNGSLAWPDPLPTENDTRIDDLWHAAVNGHGSFVAATDPGKFAQSLSDALALIAARRGSASSLATNSTTFQVNTRIFQARYWSGRWTGELAAYPATNAGIAPEPVWQASQLIPAYGTRQSHIFTWNGIGGAVFPTATQIAALDELIIPRPLTPVDGTSNAHYIAGDTSLEKRNGGTLRDREITIRQSLNDVIAPTVLGDIVNSAPIYSQELNTIFAGANDGMLHAFDGITGVEKFAYVPGGIDLSALKKLSDPLYTHSYFVDGPIAVSTTALTPSHNYLVGALGRGGKGVFGLDVINPSSFTSANVLWERNTGANMGYVLGEPLIVKLNGGATGVLVGNGINSSSGNATLFVLNVATGAIIQEIDTGVASGGLFAPRARDIDNNGTADYVYAGDLNGNLWKFDLTSSAPASWHVALSGAPLFVAKDASNKRQPITAPLALGVEPTTGNRWVFFGTGQFLTSADVSNTDVQTWYGIIDDNSAVAVVGRTSAGDGTLQKHNIVWEGKVNYDTDGDGDVNHLNNATGVNNNSDYATKNVRAFDLPTPLPSAKKGWYIDMIVPAISIVPPLTAFRGERLISAPRIKGTVIATGTIIPPTNNTCDAGGDGYENAFNAFTGASLDAAFFNVNGTRSGSAQDFSDDTITIAGVTYVLGSVDLGLGMVNGVTIIDKLLMSGGSNGSRDDIQTNPQGASARRVSWREIEKD